MGKKLFVLSISAKDIKTRKRFAPKVKIVKSKKVYDRKREKRKAPTWEPAPFSFQGLALSPAVMRWSALLIHLQPSFCDRVWLPSGG